MSSLFNQDLGGASQQTKLNQSFGYLDRNPKMQFFPFSPKSTAGDTSLFGRQNDLIQVALEWVRIPTDDIGAGNIDDVAIHFRAGIDQKQIASRRGPA